MTKKATKPARKQRRTPSQDRSAETKAILIEGAARVLEQRGLKGFNTNAVAERAGVSIGSLYQYFRNKDALLASLIEREAQPFVSVLESIPPQLPFRPVLRTIIEASIRQQTRRPELARLIDFLERQAPFEELARGTVDKIQRILTDSLKRPGAPRVEDPDVAASEVMSLIRALTDAAGERLEADDGRLAGRIYGAVCGYFGMDNLG